MSILVLILSLALILAACFLFTNAIEWFGKRLNLGHAVVGSVLAAVGTALPETIIPIIAIVHAAVAGSQAGDYVDVGIGAVAGAPFMLATLAMFVTGLAVVVYRLAGRRPLRMSVDAEVFSRDILGFLGTYGIAVGAGFLPLVLKGSPLTAVKIAVAVVLVLGYVHYVRRTLKRDTGHVGAELEELIFARLLRSRPQLRTILPQLLLALAGIVYGAHIFVQAVTEVAAMAGVPTLVLSIIITPVATELPEKFNSVLWIGKRKDTLALGNITGAMVFQSCVPMAFAVVFTPWKMHGLLLLSVVLAFAAAVLNLAWVRARGTLNPFALMSGGLLYGVFVLYLSCGQNCAWTSWLR